MGVPVLAPNSTWFSQGGTTIKRASITEINIVDSYTPTGNETASWDASAEKDGSVMVYVTGTVLTIAGNGSGKIMANADSSWVFSDINKKDYFKALTKINGGGLLDTYNATSTARMFQMCNALTTIDTSNWDTSAVGSMMCMFQMCYSLTELNVSGWQTGKVTTMLAMFNMGTGNGGSNDNLTALDVSDWDVSKVTTMQAMFAGCASLETLDVSKWVTSECKNMAAAFDNCTSLETLDVSNWNVGKVTAMENMFNRCTSLETLDVSNWNTSSCTNMAAMFYGMNGLTKPLDVSNWDVSKVTNFDHMMAHSHAILNGVENWAPSSACTNMNAMFHSVQNTSLDVSKFDTSNVQFFSQMFQSANKLTEIKGLENFNTSNGLGFEEMFQYCSSLKELNLSSFDTRKAKDGVLGSENGHLTATMQNMFQNNYRLEKITLGANFTFKGDGTTTNTANYAVLPTPSADYIYGADGNWYTEDGTAYAPADVPSNTAGTYYASLSLLGGGMSAGKKYILRSILPPIVARAMIKKYDS